MNFTPLNEIVSFIEDYQPDELKRLKQKYPNHADLFVSGQKLGGNNDQLLLLQSSICISGLKLIITKCQEYLPKIRRKISWLSRLQLTSQIIVTISGATIISILQEEKVDWLKYASSILIVIGSILTLCTQHVSTSVHNNNSLFNVYAELFQNYLQVEQDLNNIELILQVGDFSEDNKSELRRLIINTNESCIKIRKLIAN